MALQFREGSTNLQQMWLRHLSGYVSKPRESNSAAVLFVDDPAKRRKSETLHYSLPSVGSHAALVLLSQTSIGCMASFTIKKQLNAEPSA